MKKIGRPTPTALANAIIAETLKRDPDRTICTVAKVAEQFKNDRQYSPEEIDAAVAHVCRDLGIPWRSKPS
jgi:hypothetical protein